MNNLIVMLTTDSQIDRRITHEADSLESAGWKVVIVSLPHTGKMDADDARVVRLPSYSKLKKDVFLFQIYRWLSQRMPMHIYIKKFIRKFAWYIASSRENFYINLFKDTLKAYSPAIFVAHDLPMLPVACYAASQCGAKVVYDSHELYSEQEFTKSEKRQWRQLEEKYIGLSDMVMTVNPLIADELKKRYSLRSDVEVIYNATVSEYGNKNEKLFHKAFNLKNDSTIILYQGGLSAYRNLEALVQSMAFVKNKNLHLVIMGEGPLKNRLKSIVKNKNLESCVHFHDAVSQENLLQYTASADIGIIPYQAICLNNYYCTPNKLFEFISVGIPVLSSDLPAIKHIINTHKIGNVGDMSSVNSLANTINDFFSDENIMRQYKENSLKAQKVLKWENDKIINLFEKYKCA